jgi:hypothetical protein
MFDVAGVEPFGQVARDIAGTVIGKASSIPVTAAGEFTREGQPGNFG